MVNCSNNDVNNILDHFQQQLRGTTGVVAAAAAGGGGDDEVDSRNRHVELDTIDDDVKTPNTTARGASRRSRGGGRAHAFGRSRRGHRNLLIPKSITNENKEKLKSIHDKTIASFKSKGKFMNEW